MHKTCPEPWSVQMGDEAGEGCTGDEVTSSHSQCR